MSNGFLSRMPQGQVGSAVGRAAPQRRALPKQPGQHVQPMSPYQPGQMPQRMPDFQAGQMNMGQAFGAGNQALDAQQQNQAMPMGSLYGQPQEQPMMSNLMGKFGPISPEQMQQMQQMRMQGGMAGQFASQAGQAIGQGYGQQMQQPQPMAPANLRGPARQAYYGRG